MRCVMFFVASVMLAGIASAADAISGQDAAGTGWDPPTGTYIGKVTKRTEGDKVTYILQIDQGVHAGKKLIMPEANGSLQQGEKDDLNRAENQGDYNNSVTISVTDNDGTDNGGGGKNVTCTSASGGC